MHVFVRYVIYDKEKNIKFANGVSVQVTCLLSTSFQTFFFKTFKGTDELLKKRYTMEQSLHSVSIDHISTVRLV